MRTRQEWKNIDGIAYIEDEKVKTTRMRPLIQDLDELPFMATDFLEELQLKHGKNVTAYLVSSRGCYKNCSFYSMADFILVGLKLKISQKTEEKKSSRENTGGKRKTPSQSFHSKKKMLSDIYEAYAEGKIDKDTFLRKKENIREMFETEDVEAETKTAVVRTDLENLLEEVQSTADDSWLTREVLKVFVKEIWIFPESEMKIIWKPEWALEGAGKDSIGEKEK